MRITWPSALLFVRRGKRTKGRTLLGITSDPVPGHMDSRTEHVPEHAHDNGSGKEGGACCFSISSPTPRVCSTDGFGHVAASVPLAVHAAQHLHQPTAILRCCVVTNNSCLQLDHLCHAATCSGHFHSTDMLLMLLKHQPPISRRCPCC